MEMLKLTEMFVSLDNRTNFDPAKLKQLKASIEKKGIIEALIVRKGTFEGTNKQYEIICGARRFRVAQELKMTEVPVSIRDMSDEEAAEIRTVDNLQREDLNPLDEAREIERMVKQFGRSAEEVADKIGKPAAHVKARLQLLKLPEPVARALADGSITANHGSVLARIPDQKKQAKLLDIILHRKLSANAAENMLAHAGKDINEAPFDTAACKRCPNLGKNQAGLFDKDTDIDSVCLDGVCWARKCRGCAGKGSKAGKGQKVVLVYRDLLEKAIQDKLDTIGIPEMEMVARTLGIDCAKLKEPAAPAAGKPAAKPAEKPKKKLVTRVTVKGKDGAALSADAQKAAEGLGAMFGDKGKK